MTKVKNLECFGEENKLFDSMIKTEISKSAYFECIFYNINLSMSISIHIAIGL